MITPTARAVSVLPRLLSIMVPALALVTLTYLPPFNPYGTERFDLTGPLVLAAYWVSYSGGLVGIPIIAVLMTLLIVSRGGITWKQRALETVIIIVGGGLIGLLPRVNEQLLKKSFAVPRPNIKQLATTPTDKPALGKSAEDFYTELPDKAERSKYLRTVTMPDMHEEVRDHWVHETGYSFPSGHSFSSMMFATFFLGLGLRCLTGPCLWPFYLLPVWGTAVCVSRTMLRVHSPTDVCFGGLEGVALGCLAFVLVSRTMPEMGQKAAAAAATSSSPE